MKSTHHSQRGSALLIVAAIFFVAGVHTVTPFVSKVYGGLMLAALLCAGYHEWRYSYWIRRHQ